ncbi:MAG: molecular chaperone [Herbinix sp.]|jgi:hypothetical protein|nr:molecular chaperone [Herbinix sp.]
MGQFEGIFKRYEKKYLLNEIKYDQLLQSLKDKLEIDAYGDTSICNIYFDTPQHLLIRNSLEKPVYKEKLRLRSYGTPTEGDKVYVELKKKYKGIVYKRRVKLELSEAEQYLYYRRPLDHPSQIEKEIDWFLRFYQDIEPSMYISYRRIAMYGIEDPQLRVTFDTEIQWRDTDLWLEYGSWGNQLLQDNERLMEIKMPGAMPIWLAHILDEMEIYPISFSKYGMGYQQSLQMTHIEKNKGEILYA